LSGGTVKCWGTFFWGSPEEKIKGVETVESLEAALGISSGSGTYAPCEVLENHSVGCWNSNVSGGFGNGKSESREVSATPVTVAGVSNATAGSAGSVSACAVLGGGGIDCWGTNEYGAVGDGHHGASEIATASGVVGITKATKLSVGDDHACAIENEEVKCWGTNGEGQLGNGETSEVVDEPVRVTGISSSAVEVSAGGSTCALLKSKQVKCWGWNGYGELGDGTTTERTTPVFVAGL